MKKIVLLAMLIPIGFTPPDFMTQQLHSPRVREAMKTNGKAVDELLTSKGINTQSFDLFLRAFKKEKVVEVWGRNKGTEAFTLLKSYDFCDTSGKLGPKRLSGDRQIPEGFYTIDAYNPESKYFLSFRINYPNASDKVLSDQLNPGDSIYIHGHCVTIGCIPLGDEVMKELYLLVIKAKSAGQDVPVHIFPSKMDDAGYAALKSEFSSDATKLEFWSWLKPGYDAFEQNKTLPNVSIDATTGKYSVN